MVSGKVSFRDRLCDDGSLQRTKDDASSSEALEQCPANWTLRFTLIRALIFMELFYNEFAELIFAN